MDEAGLYSPRPASSPATHQVIGMARLAFTPGETYLLTTNGVSNDVSVIDVASLRVIKTIQVGELPWGIAISRQ